jgi:hypothetical protein
MWPRVRSAFAQLMRAQARAALCAAVAAVALLGAGTPPTPPPHSVDLTKVQPKALLPKVALHTEYIVAVNKLGQVTRVISGKMSKDKSYNLHTYGNAMQAFIRTPDGKAISGSYRLTYDYNPKTANVHRDVALVKAGGVDPNAVGAVIKMFDDVQKHRKTPAKAKPPATPGPERSAEMTPGPQPSGNLRLPALQQITKTPPP